MMSRIAIHRKSENISRLLKMCLWMNVPAKLPPPSGTPSKTEGEPAFLQL